MVNWLTTSIVLICAKVLFLLIWLYFRHKKNKQLEAQRARQEDRIQHHGNTVINTVYYAPQRNNDRNQVDPEPEIHVQEFEPPPPSYWSVMNEDLRNSGIRPNKTC